MKTVGSLFLLVPLIFFTDMMMTGDWAHDLRCTSQAHARGFEPLTGRITDIVLGGLSKANGSAKVSVKLRCSTLLTAPDCLSGCLSVRL